MKRFVYLGGLHPAGADLSPHLRSRTAVGDILIDSGIETVVLQAGIVIGSGSASFEMIRHLTTRLPVMTTPKWVHNKIQPIAIDDVLHYLSEAATAPVPTSRTWDVGGPDVFEYGEAMQVYAEVAGLRRRTMIVLPWLTPKNCELVDRSGDTDARWPGSPPADRVTGMRCVMGDHDVDDVIAPPPAGGLTPYRDAVVTALQRGPLPSDPQWAHVGRN